MSPKVDELLKRIAKLVRQNQQLQDQLKELNGKYEELLKNQVNKDNIREALVQQVPEEIYPEERQQFKTVTVLFANIHGFSKISSVENADALMDELDQIFFQFDAIAQKYNIEKIKTIGDSYMAAGGIPKKNSTNPIQVVLAAMEMQQYLETIHRNHRNDGRKVWDIVVSIHTGPVMANIIGKKKVAYEIKGDTVNITSRIESCGSLNKILISVMTYELIKEFFVCEYYGKLPVKYQKDLELYTVVGIKPELSLERKGLSPTRPFRIKYGLVQFNDIQEMILDKLEKELPKDLYYHNVKHTVDVVTEAELIGWGEGVTEEEILLLKTAALFHDIGHIVEYDNHELRSTEFAREYLPKFKYKEEQIETICNTILATKLPNKPQNSLEEILCDSDLDYLGRPDFIPVSSALYEELKARNRVGSFNEWNKMQLKFISSHQYFTQTARKLREVNKQKQIERLMQIIK